MGVLILNQTNIKPVDTNERPTTKPKFQLLSNSHLNTKKHKNLRYAYILYAEFSKIDTSINSLCMSLCVYLLFKIARIFVYKMCICNGGVSGLCDDSSAQGKENLIRR